MDKNKKEHLEYWIKSDQLNTEEKLSMLYGIYLSEIDFEKGGTIWDTDPELRSFVATGVAFVVIWNAVKVVLTK